MLICISHSTSSFLKSHTIKKNDNNNNRSSSSTPDGWAPDVEFPILEADIAKEATEGCQSMEYTTQSGRTGIRAIVPPVAQQEGGRQRVAAVQRAGPVLKRGGGFHHFSVSVRVHNNTTQETFKVW